MNNKVEIDSDSSSSSPLVSPDFLTEEQKEKACQNYINKKISNKLYYEKNKEKRAIQKKEKLEEKQNYEKKYNELLLYCQKLEKDIYELKLICNGQKKESNSYIDILPKLSCTSL